MFGKLVVLGGMTFITGTLCLVLWPVVIKQARRLPGPGSAYFEQNEDGLIHKASF